MQPLLFQETIHELLRGYRRPRSICEGVWWAAFRIANCAKAVFGYSNWQRARRLAEARALQSWSCVLGVWRRHAVVIPSVSNVLAQAERTMQRLAETLIYRTLETLNGDDHTYSTRLYEPLRDEFMAHTGTLLRLI